MISRGVEYRRFNCGRHPQCDRQECQANQNNCGPHNESKINRLSFTAHCRMLHSCNRPGTSPWPTLPHQNVSWVTSRRTLQNCNEVGRGGPRCAGLPARPAYYCQQRLFPPGDSWQIKEFSAKDHLSISDVSGLRPQSRANPESRKRMRGNARNKGAVLRELRRQSGGNSAHGHRCIRTSDPSAAT